MTDSSPDTNIEALLEYARRTRGFDFTGYKRPSLIRRINKRMQTLGVEGYDKYLGYLEVNPEEFNLLFNTLLINVTSFFRDRPSWDLIQQEVLPKIVAQKDSTESIRVWCAGCASGEEAYTIAITIAEVVGIEAFRDRVKIYATDVDEEALTQARQATYSEEDLSNLTPEQLELFFTESDNGYTFRKDLRRAMIFGRHDLIQDAPISKIDLLTCRNTLMYFNAETQARILARFHFALREGGHLFLGKAEMLLTHSSLFAPLHLKCRLFTKVSKITSSDSLLILAQTGRESAIAVSSEHVRLHEAAFDAAPSAHLVIDSDGSLALVNGKARSTFNLSLQDVGRPLQDLEISYRPVELRSCIEQVYRDRRMVYLRDVEWMRFQDLIYLDVQILPLIDLVDRILGISISFIDVTRAKHLNEELEHSNQELEMAYEELQSANEELETTNEELQSSNEELETTNEELQSTNEELETMNEELQSTNEELQTVNEELERRGSELNRSNAFLESILASLKGGVVVVDRDLRVQIWNFKSEDLWGLRPEEAVEQNFLNLDIGLPVEQLRQSIRSCLSGSLDSDTEIVLPAINRRGRSIQCRVTCTALIGTEREAEGVILLMEECAIE
ncbi:MAG: PAS domain-containing protein [Plectolyngbya sp. WJT66-NPBG17]|nr:PAS domain-containing protein [Plectolyngbya sp. WJT66-NPBG17]